MKRLFLALGILPLALAVPLADAGLRDNPYVDRDAPCFRWPAIDRDGDGVWDRVDRCIFTLKGCNVDAQGCALDGDHDGVCDGLDQCPNTPTGMAVDGKGCHAGAGAMKDPRGDTPEAKKAEKPAPPAVSPPQSETERRLVAEGRIRLENVYFETASARLLPASRASLDEAGRALEKLHYLRIEVEGHTDTRGSDAYNLRLSQARAEAVRDYLRSNFRLRPENLIVQGYGESRPETQERDDTELLRNRRVVLRVLNPEELPKGVEVEK